MATLDLSAWQSGRLRAVFVCKRGREPPPVIPDGCCAIVAHCEERFSFITYKNFKEKSYLSETALSRLGPGNFNLAVSKKQPFWYKRTKQYSATKQYSERSLNTLASFKEDTNSAGKDSNAINKFAALGMLTKSNVFYYIILTCNLLLLFDHFFLKYHIY
uniref:Uncharacterized protein n=1 Tax=Micrurus spixii TaxID=129469 RepID=A0A2D4MJ29_9SAUR